MNYAHGNYDNFSGFFYLIHRKLQKIKRGHNLILVLSFFKTMILILIGGGGSVRYPTERKR